MDCIFCKIAKGEFDTKFLYQDEEVMVFPDIHPVKPVHLLIVPKKHISEFMALEDQALLQKLFSVAKNMIKREGLTDKGHRIGINGGGAQAIDHLHIHLMGPIKNTEGM